MYVSQVLSSQTWQLPNMKQNPMKNIFLLCITLLSFFSINAQLCEWTGAVSTDWNNASNWSCGHVPLATDLVSISASGSDDTVNLSGIGLADQLYVDGNGAMLEILSSGSIVVSNLIAVGSLGEIKNAGSITVNTNNFAGLFIDPDGLFKNNSTGSLTINGSSPSTQHGVALGSFFGSAELVNDGLIVTSGVLLEAVQIWDGTYSGNGSITGGAVLYPQGTISPGSSPGVLTIDIYDGSNGGVHQIEIDGIAGAGNPSGHDQIVISGPAFLGGTLTVTLGYAPNVGDSHKLFTCASGCSGTFPTVNLPTPPAGTSWALEYNANDVTLILNGATLPIVLETFEVELIHETKTLISWRTSYEKGVDKFEVERSMNGIEWDAIGTIKAINNELGSSYELIDDQLAAGTNYYRLKHMDLDGFLTFSEIRTITFRKSEEVFKAYPNPTSQSIRIDANIQSISLLNLEGEVVLSKENNDSGLAIDLKNLSAGIYVLRYNLNDQMHQEKLVVQ